MHGVLVARQSAEFCSVYVCKGEPVLTALLILVIEYVARIVVERQYLLFVQVDGEVYKILCKFCVFCFAVLLLSPCIEGGMGYIFRYEVTCVEEPASRGLYVCNREGCAYAASQYLQCIFVGSLCFALSEICVCYTVEYVGNLVLFDDKGCAVYLYKFYSVALVAESVYAFVLTVGDFL